MVRVDLGDEATQFTEDVVMSSSPGHVLPPAGQPGLLPPPHVGLGDVVHHQAQGRELASWEIYGYFVRSIFIIVINVIFYFVCVCTSSSSIDKGREGSLI